MDKTQLRDAVLYVGHPGGDLVVTTEDGEVYRIGLPPGIGRGSAYVRAVPQGASVEVDGPVVAFGPEGGRLTRMRGQGFEDTGANAEYVPEVLPQQYRDLIAKEVRRRTEQVDARRKLREEQRRAEEPPVIEPVEEPEPPVQTETPPVEEPTE